MTGRENDFRLDIIFLVEFLENLGFLVCWTMDEKKKLGRGLKGLQ